ncbi:MAG: hypothetical protein K6C99_05480 [Lachnospiraceae bacterium]|nr:hypothetical protein [Lachnospiraceae bacterium]
MVKDDNKINVKNERRIKISVIGMLILIVLSLVSYGIFMYKYGANFLDSDAAAEMILSNLLSKEGGVLSRSWYYSSELRVLNTQLIFSFLFHIFNNWKIVRITGGILLLIILCTSALFLGKSIKMTHFETSMFALVMLLPVSDLYLEFVMAWSYYIPHIVISFVTIALLLFAINHEKKTVVFSGLNCILALIAGMGGWRQLINLYIPLVIVAGWLYIDTNFTLKNDIKKNIYKTDILRLLIINCFLFLSATIGFLINSTVLRKNYEFKRMGSVWFTDFSSERMINMLSAVLHMFGYDQGKATSFSSIKNGVCFLIVLLGIIAVRDILKNKIYSIEEDIIARYLTAAFVIMLLIEVFSDALIADRYIIPISVFIVPVIIIFLKRRYENINQSKEKKTILLLSFLFFVIVSGCSLYNYCFSDFRKETEYNQITESLLEQGYDKGFGTFWNGDVFTELSNGKIEMYCWDSDISNVKAPDDIYKWLQKKSHVNELPSGKVFCILSADERNSELAKKINAGIAIYESEEYTVWGYESYNDMVKE